MIRYLARLLFGYILTGQMLTVTLFSQGITDPEAEYTRVRDMAFSGNLVEASAAARGLVNAFPSYGDARILLGRILAWQKDYMNAAAVIDSLLEKEPANEDALSARRDIAQWSKDNTPATTDVRLGYSFDTFGKPFNRFWQIFKAGAGHRFSWGPGSVAINAGNLITGEPDPLTATGFLFEAEAYPKISKRNYAYVSYAFSPFDYFPAHRAAVELWQMFNRGWAASAGMNFFYFDRDIFIGGASVEKYTGKYWMSAKGFIYFKDNGPTYSAYINARRYFKDSDYLQLSTGAGTAPDEPFDIETDIARLSAYSIRLTGNILFSERVTIRATMGYSTEEYLESDFRNRFDGSINIIYSLSKQ
jgi:YaiO family outer membrane protein